MLLLTPHLCIQMPEKEHALPMVSQALCSVTRQNVHLWAQGRHELKRRDRIGTWRAKDRLDFHQRLRGLHASGWHPEGLLASLWENVPNYLSWVRFRGRVISHPADGIPY